MPSRHLPLTVAPAKAPAVRKEQKKNGSEEKRNLPSKRKGGVEASTQAPGLLSLHSPPLTSTLPSSSEPVYPPESTPEAAGNTTVPDLSIETPPMVEGSSEPQIEPVGPTSFVPGYGSEGNIASPGESADGSSEVAHYHHNSEIEFSRLLDFYGIEWQYEPRQFPLVWREGRATEMFTPDFYLPEYDLYIELTTMRQALVRRKNRKLRMLRALYPEINIKLIYRRDYQRLLERFGFVAYPGDEASTGAVE